MSVLEKIDAFILEKLNENKFKGYDEAEVRQALQPVADAAHMAMVTNSTTPTLEQAIMDPRPIFLQNHGTLRKTFQAWSSASVNGE